MKNMSIWQKAKLFFEKIFVRLSEQPIYVVVLTDGRESANKNH